MLIVGVLLFTVFLRFLLVGLLVPYMLATAPRCPACGAPDTARLRSPWLARLAAWIEHRWCLECGWSGWVKRPATTQLPRVVGSGVVGPSA